MAATNPPGTAAATNVRYGVLVLISLASGSAYLTRYCLSVANTTIGRELRLDDVRMGQVMAAWGLGYFLCQVPGGWLGNWIGTRKTLAGLSVLWSICTVWTSWATSFRPLWWSRLTFGLAQAGLVPNSAAVIKNWFSPARRGFASACIAASMSVGGVLTMKLTGELLDTYGYDWRRIFQAYSAVGVVWAGVFYWYFRTRPEQHPWVNAAELARIRGTALNQADAARVPKPSLEPEPPRTAFWQMLSSRSMWGICIQSYFRAAGYLLFVTWLPAFLEYAFGLSVAEAANYTTWPLIGVIAGALSGGFFVDCVYQRTGSRKWSRVGIAAGALGLCAALTFAATLATTPGVFSLLLAAGAFLSGVANPPAWAATMDIAGRHTAVAMGVMNMTGAAAGFTVPNRLGVLIDRIKTDGGDWNAVIFIHVGFYVCAALSWLLVNPDRPIDDNEDTVPQTTDPEVGL